MKDYDIKIKKAAEATLFATDNDTIVVPSKVKFDTDRDQADIDIDGVGAGRTDQGGRTATGIGTT